MLKKVRLRGITTLILMVLVAIPIMGVSAEESQLELATDHYVLGYGSSGETVVTLQTELADLGLYDYRIDGLFGPITKQGVLQFQLQNMFKIDGWVGPETLSGMPKVEAVFTERVVEKKETPKLKAEPKVESKPKPKPKAKEVTATNTMTVNASAYTAKCEGCSGITAKGTNVRNTIYHSSGHRIIATDPNVIPMGTIVRINGETYIADDVGGLIKGYKIDILVSTKQEAYAFGRQSLQIEIVE